MHACLQRYRALFALRNKGGEAAVAVLGEAFGASSALLKHEVAYVMGQMQHPASAAVLCKVLKVGVTIPWWSFPGPQTSKYLTLHSMTWNS